KSNVTTAVTPVSTFLKLFENILGGKHKKLQHKTMDYFAILMLVWMIRQAETSHIVCPEEYYHFEKSLPSQLVIDAHLSKDAAKELKTTIDVSKIKQDTDKPKAHATKKHKLKEGFGQEDTSPSILNRWGRKLGFKGSRPTNKKRKWSTDADTGISAEPAFPKFKQDKSLTNKNGGHVKGDYVSIAQEVRQSDVLTTSLQRTSSNRRYFVEGDFRAHSIRKEQTIGKFENSDNLNHKHILIKVLTLLYSYVFECFRVRSKQLLSNVLIHGDEKQQLQHNRIATIYFLANKLEDPYEVRYSLVTQALSLLQSRSMSFDSKREIMMFLKENNWVGNVECQFVSFRNNTRKKKLKQLISTFQMKH
ncbi:hypothetical protein RFI_10692, partial [Reticulomyxa filosa]